ncbi:SH3 domain-containing protein [Mesorhizobium sp. CN2-181]|uniref:SH3 domain-containing protein n=1 Tax=Mesorhizobium yinganensis TaxID=3157707 RepID=UPI0032B7A030
MAKKPAKAKSRSKFSVSSMMKLPRLRWLVLGAVAAGVWAMTQEPPKREHWQRQRDEQASVEKKKSEPAPSLAAAPMPKPSEIITASIPRPERPVAARSETLRTTEKVRLRKEASTTSAVVATLKGGQTVEASVTEGKWRKVSVDGMVGWVHGDYLRVGPGSVAQPADSAKPTPAVAVVPRPAPQAAPAPEIALAPRPKENVAPDPEPAQAAVEEPEAIPAAVPISLPEDKSMWGALRPARAPQEGDCQCPYDLMLNGKQCGERSAYAKGKGPQCYF